MLLQSKFITGLQVKYSSRYCSRPKRKSTEKEYCYSSFKNRIYQKRGTNKILLLYILTSGNYLISSTRELHRYICTSPQHYRLYRGNYYTAEFLPQIRSKGSCTDEQKLDKYLLLHKLLSIC